MMQFAGMGVCIGAVGGGCPDCHGPLDAEAVYTEGKYDITIEQIAKGGYGTGIINNIRALHRSGRIELTPREQRILDNRRR